MCFGGTIISPGASPSLAHLSFSTIRWEAPIYRILPLRILSHHRTRNNATSQACRPQKLWVRINLSSLKLLGSLSSLSQGQRNQLTLSRCTQVSELLRFSHSVHITHVHELCCCCFFPFLSNSMFLAGQFWKVEKEFHFLSYWVKKSVGTWYIVGWTTELIG